ncbi:hypothetical protein PsorP6_011774 [Peronosclerospora sorghi]|uniref:Uncharacterized protein n=1 Tax=Peronosclerospora sorghi TaxID=230839 RepID=A0ACC0WJX4_9STRA|nr:hypothetical protein PsorP6_011774 [Peronosclerospora sorghi]
MLLDTESFSWYAPAIQGSPPSARTLVVFGSSGGRNRQSSVHILYCGNLGIKDDHTVIVEGKVPSSRTYHSAVAVGKDKIVYFGGNDSCKSFNDVHVLKKRCLVFGCEIERRQSLAAGQHARDSIPETSVREMQIAGIGFLDGDWNRGDMESRRPASEISGKKAADYFLAFDRC